MIAILINGKKIAEKINRASAVKVKKLQKKGVQPKLAVILVGDDKASAIYVRKKEKLARQLGVDFALHHLPAEISQDELVKKIKEIQADKKLSGLIIQLPLPDHLYRPDVLNNIALAVDVDFLSEAAMAEVENGINKMEPPTPGAIMTILRELKINFKKNKFIVIGQGVLVGKPLTMLLRRAGVSVVACDSKTKNIPAKCQQADVVISCVGKKDLVRGDMIKKGAIVIDAGFSFYKGKSYGDVNFAEASERAKYITPTPGGVGPITVALLLKNTVACAENLLSLRGSASDRSNPMN